jgi:transaldolase
VINTMPENTLHAFADHGHVEPTLDRDLGAATGVLSGAATEGVDLDAITSELERQGVQAFCDSYAQLLSCIEGKRTSLAAVA